MDEKPKFERPTTLEEEHTLTLARSEYLLKHIEEQEKQISLDPLTGLSTRKVLMNELESSLPFIRGEVEEHHRRGIEQLTEAALVFIDLDNFKQVNDTRGHSEGDQVLKKVADILTSSVRKSDIVARFGGDEFFLFLPSADKDKALEIANKICVNLRKDPLLAELAVTASIGVRAVDTANVADSETLIKQADAAAYRAKEGGKNQVAAYEEGMQMRDSGT